MYKNPRSSGAVYMDETKEIHAKVSDYKHSYWSKHEMLIDQIRVVTIVACCHRIFRESIETLKNVNNFSMDDGYMLPSIGNLL